MAKGKGRPKRLSDEPLLFHDKGVYFEKVRAGTAGPLRVWVAEPSGPAETRWFASRADAKRLAVWLLDFLEDE